MLFTMEENKTSNPENISFFSFLGVVFHPKDISHMIEQLFGFGLLVHPDNRAFLRDIMP